MRKEIKKFEVCCPDSKPRLSDRKKTREGRRMFGKIKKLRKGCLSVEVSVP